MSEADVAACLKDQDLFNRVKEARDSAARTLEIRSFPTFFVNGVTLGGNVDLDAFDHILAPMLLT
jgi:predicted DsbA family dithiol-disulfide isomerase